MLEEKLKIITQDSADIVLPGWLSNKWKILIVFLENPKTDTLIESLKNEIEDLKHELLSVQVAKARSLISEEPSLKGSSSFAEELANCAEPGLKEKYETLEQTHEEVKKYLDKILTNVIERDPSLLMVNPWTAWWAPAVVLVFSIPRNFIRSSIGKLWQGYYLYVY